MVRRLEVPGLTAEVLARLYLEDRLTESEIGSRFGIGQVMVGRLRTRFGIATLSKGARTGASLPATLSDRQHQILIGSLLGDGSLDRTSEASARWIETHSAAQEAYLRWKAEELGPFVSRMYPTTKRDKKSGKVFQGWGFTTKSCPVFQPFHALFYPDGVRVFPANLPVLMTPLVLAVWYMDDGSVSAHGWPRIAFGLDDSSLDRCCRGLQVLGLSPTVYGSGTEREIGFPGQRGKFRDLVAPHLHANMAYKLPAEDSGRAACCDTAIPVQQDGSNAAYRLPAPRGLSLTDVRQLYTVDLLTDVEIGSRLGVSDQVVSKHRAAEGISTITERQRRERRLKPQGFSLDALTPDILAGLVRQMGLAKIAVLHGVRKPAIKRLCLKWGIQGLSRSERCQVAPA